MKKRKKIELEITELFMAQADRDRRFYGIIKRPVDEYGNPFVYGKIYVNDVLIYSKADDQDILGAQLDELVIMILEFGLHKNKCISSTLYETPFFHN